VSHGGGGFHSDAQRRWFFATIGDDKAASERWASGLSDKERTTLQKYTGTETSQSLNEALREGRALTREQAEMVRYLDTAIAKAPTFEAEKTLYRGVNFASGLPGAEELARLDQSAREAMVRESVASWAEDTFPAGRQFSLGGYQSTSTGVDPALDASLSRRSPGVIFKIRARTGAPLDALSRWDDEQEYLLSRRTLYRVTGVRRSVTFERSSGREVQRTVVNVDQVM
jgi:hypothetical protein